MAGPRTEFPSTDFAITSVNVPDRLDLREVDDRKQQDEASLYARRRPAVLIWVRKLLPYFVVLALLGVAANWLSEQRDTLAPARLAQRLSAALQVPVQIRDSRLQTTPAPALVLAGVDLGGKVRLEEVTLQFTAPNLWQAVMSGQRRWGDVVVSSASLNFDQAGQLLNWLALLGQVVPDSVTRVRFAQVTFPGSGLLPDRYEAVTRREPSGAFASVTLRRLDTPGSVQLQFTPDKAGGPVAFQCDAADWRPPFAPRAAWTELVGSGRVSSSAIELEKFTLGASFGAIEGQLSVRRMAPSAWMADGHVSSVGLDVPTVILQTAGPAPVTPEAVAGAVTSMAGTAAVEALLKGTGTTPEEALSHLVASGQIKVRSAVLNGINLGYAASRPSTNAAGSAASTRFTQFEASFTAGAGPTSSLVFRDIHGTAGALTTTGEVTVAPGLGLDGLLHVNLGGTRVQAPLRIRVHGDVPHPLFGR
jgi:hypothetical protein